MPESPCRRFGQVSSTVDNRNIHILSPSFHACCPYFGPFSTCLAPSKVRFFNLTQVSVAFIHFGDGNRCVLPFLSPGEYCWSVADPNASFLLAPCASLRLSLSSPRLLRRKSRSLWAIVCRVGSIRPRITSLPRLPWFPLRRWSSRRSRRRLSPRSTLRTGKPPLNHRGQLRNGLFT